MLILIGPSASGKTEVANLLVKTKNFKKIVTCTTRPIRVGEINGVSYHFLTTEEFQKMKDNDEFVETASYSSYCYGTRKVDVANDKLVILEPNGFRTFKRVMKDQILSVFLETSEEVRINRMKLRQDKPENIAARITNDRLTFTDELKNEVDYVVVNDNKSLDELAEEIYLIYVKKFMQNKGV